MEIQIRNLGLINFLYRKALIETLGKKTNLSQEVKGSRFGKETPIRKRKGKEKMSREKPQINPSATKKQKKPHEN